MNRSKFGLILGLAASLLFLSACGGGGGGGSTPTPHRVTFTIVDSWRTPINGAQAFVGNAATPTATAGADGVVTLTLDDATNDVVFKAPNSRNFGFLNRDWSTVSTWTVVLLNLVDPNLTPGTGDINFSVSGGTPGAQVLVVAISRTRSLGNAPTLDGSGAAIGTISNVIEGTYVVLGRTLIISPIASQTDWGVSSEITVTSGGTTVVPDIPLIQGGIEFNFTFTGGLVGADIVNTPNLFNRPDFTQNLGGQRVTDLNVTSVTQPVTFPRNSTNLNGSQVWFLNTSSQDTLFPNNRDRLFIAHFYQGAAEVDAAALTKNVAFVDLGMSANLPAHDSASVSTRPILGATLVDTTGMDYMDYRIFRRDVGNGVWLQEIRVRDYNINPTMSITLPPSLTLNTNSFYRYRARARIFETNIYYESGKEDVCFSTGATTPSGAALCTP